MALYLSSKEIIRYKGRYLLFSLVIALITTLVLFIAALAQGLADANKQFLDKLNADLVVFQKNVNLSAVGSQITLNKLPAIRQVPGVMAVGPIGLSSGTLVFNDNTPSLDISLIGIDPRQLGQPAVKKGRALQTNQGRQTVIDSNVATKTGIKVGDKITLRTIINNKEVYNTIEVIGITDDQQFLYAPSIFLPYDTWNNFRPQPTPNNNTPPTIANIIAIKTDNPAQSILIAESIIRRVKDVEVVDRKTAYEASPGYQAQQSTLDTQRGFTLLIGILVIGGFFQIQTLQKVPQIGVLKAIGTPNNNIAFMVIFQIILLTVIGITIGTIVTLGLSLILPYGIPIVFSGKNTILAIISLLFIGPIGGLVSVRLALRVEPLAALGMN